MQTLTVRQMRIRVWKLIVSLISTATILFLLFQLTDIEIIIQLLKRAQWFWIFVGFGWYGVTNICRSYRFAGLLGWGGWRKPLHLLSEMIALSFLNNIFPARFGELLFPILLRRRKQITLGRGMGFLLIVRLFDLLAVVTLFLIFAWARREALTRISSVLFWYSFIIGIFIVAMLLILPWIGNWALASLEWLAGLLMVNSSPSFIIVQQFSGRLVLAINQVREPRLFLQTYLRSALGWLTTFAWFAAFLRAIQLPTAYPLVVVGSTFATIAKAIPFVTFSGFGAHDAGWAFGYGFAGMPLETAVASGFAVNILTLATSILFMFGTIIYEIFANCQ